MQRPACDAMPCVSSPALPTPALDYFDLACLITAGRLPRVRIAEGSDPQDLVTEALVISNENPNPNEYGIEIVDVKSEVLA